MNISIAGGGVIEVKGVQQLDQLEKIIEFEAKRQHGLQIISDRIKSANFGDIYKQNDVLEPKMLLKRLTCRKT